MPLSAGEAAMAGDIQETVAHAVGVAAGDAVALAGGEAVDANTEANALAGVASESGDTVILHGVCVANVAAGVTQGTELTAGNATGGTSGQLIAGAGRGLALSDVGGTWHGINVPAGYAVVLIS